jgi:ribosomal protein L25 (general stress protein Ctc)
MAQVRPLKIQSRERTGTGGARATRRAGLVPGVVYGGKGAPAAIAIETRELEKAITTASPLRCSRSSLTAPRPASCRAPCSSTR